MFPAASAAFVPSRRSFVGGLRGEVTGRQHSQQTKGRSFSSCGPPWRSYRSALQKPAMAIAGDFHRQSWTQRSNASDALANQFLCILDSESFNELM